MPGATRICARAAPLLLLALVAGRVAGGTSTLEGWRPSTGGDGVGGDGVRAAARKVLQEARIVGGEDSTEGRFPYMCSLRNRSGKHQCGAVLIQPKWALTAAHCVHPNYQTDSGPNDFLMIGAYRSTDDDTVAGVEEIRIVRTYIHPNFTINGLRAGGDVALLALEEPSKLTAAPLPDPQHFPDGELLALGWGRNSPVLQQAYLEIESSEVCESTWDNIGPSVICASSKSADTCRGRDITYELGGDSGGPLIIPHAPERKISDGKPKLDTLIALTTFGDTNCTRFEIPGAYTLIAPYLQWIENVLKDESLRPDPKTPQECGQSVATYRSIGGELPIQYNELLQFDLRDCDSVDMTMFDICDQELRESVGCCTQACGSFLRSVPSECWSSIVHASCASDSDTLADGLDKLSQLCGGLPAKCLPPEDLNQACLETVIEPKAPLPDNLIPFTFGLIKLEAPESCEAFDFADFQKCASDIGMTHGCCTEACTNFLGEISDECWAGVEDVACRSNSNEMEVLLDLLSQRCDTRKRQFECVQVTGKTVGFDADASSMKECERDSSCREINVELLQATENGDLTAVKRALAAGADVEATDTGNYQRTPLHWAAHQGHVHIVRYLLLKGSDIEASSKTGVTALMYAASAGEVSVVKLLLGRGADIDALDKGRWSALVYAARYGHSETVQVLADKGADLEVKDTLWQYSPLVWAALNGHLDTVEQLISAGADLEARTRRGWTPLMLAVGEDDYPLVELLLENGANSSAATPADTHSTALGLLPAGSSPLHIAARVGNKDVIKVLIKFGASKDARDSVGDAPRDVVHIWSMNREELVELLDVTLPISRDRVTQSRTKLLVVMSARQL